MDFQLMKLIDKTFGWIEKLPRILALPLTAAVMFGLMLLYDFVYITIMNVVWSLRVFVVGLF